MTPSDLAAKLASEVNGEQQRTLESLLLYARKAIKGGPAPIDGFDYRSDGSVVVRFHTALYDGHPVPFKYEIDLHGRSRILHSKKEKSEREQYGDKHNYRKVTRGEYAQLSEITDDEGWWPRLTDEELAKIRADFAAGFE